MKILIIGGLRHGEWVETLDGTKVWLDIQNAAQHVIRRAEPQVTDLETGEVLEAYRLFLAVHRDLIGPNEPAAVSAALNAMAMNHFARSFGERLEIPKEPRLAVPGSDG